MLAEKVREELQEANNKLYNLNVAFYNCPIESKARRDELFYAIRNTQNRICRLKCKLHWLEHSNCEERSS